MKKNFPKKIYVKRWQDTDGQWYFSAEERAERLADEVGQTVDVGVYELVDHGQTVSEPMFWLKGSPIPRPKRHR